MHLDSEILESSSPAKQKKNPLFKGFDMKDLSQEKELINKCLQGSSESWQLFIKQYSSLVYYVIQKVIRSKDFSASPEDIDDLHNDIFLSIMDKNGHKLRLYEGKNGCSFSTWIRVIAVRAAIDYMRRKKESVSFSDDRAEMETGQKEAFSNVFLKVLEDDEQKSALKNLIKSLAPRDQLFMRLFYYDEVPPRDIARVFNYTTSAVYSRGNFLRKKLKKALEKKQKNKEVNSSIYNNCRDTDLP